MGTREQAKGAGYSNIKERGHFDPTTPEPFRDLASPGHCLWQWLWRSIGAIMVAGKLAVRWFPPER